MPLQEFKIQPKRNLFSKTAEYTPPVLKNYKAKRAEEILTTTIPYQGNTFEVDEASMDRFDRVIDIANWKYNQLLASGMSPSEAYADVYQNNTVTWKTHDNDFVTISIETVCELQELALQNLQQIWIKWG